MDYFNDLLESYDLLKKRQFKLTLIEGSDDAGVLKIMKQVGTGKKSSDKAEHNGVGLWETDLEDPTKSEIVGSLGYDTITLTAGSKSQINSGDTPKKQEKIDRIIARLSGQQAEVDPNAEPAEVEKPNPLEPLAPLAKEFQAGIDRMFPDGALESPLVPGLLRNKVNSREQKAAKIALNKAAGKQQGLGITGTAKQDPTVTDRLLASTNVSVEKAEAGLKLANAMMKGIEELHEGKVFNANQLRELSEGVEVTKEGVLVNGIFIDYRTKADDTNDLLTNMANQINKEIKKHNEEKCSGFEKGSDVQKECTVQEIAAPSTDARELLDRADRGLLIEEVDVIRDLASSIKNLRTSGKPVQELEKRLKNLYSSALRRGTAEQIKNTFEQGMSLSARKIISEADGADSVIITEHAVNHLVNEEGMTEAGAYELVSSAALSDDGGSRALLLLIATSRGFSKSLKGLEILDAKITGGDGATLKGQKTDEERVVTAPSLKVWKKEYEQNMGSLEKALEEASKSCDDPNVGLGGIGEADDEGNMILRTESKALTSTKTSRVKMGEGNNSRVIDLLNGKSNSTTELEFVDATITRIDNAFKNSGNKDFKGVSVKQQAKSFHDDLDSRMKSLRGPLAKEPVMGPDGKKIEGAGSEAISSWLKTKGTKTLDNEKRAKLAKEALLVKDPTGPQKEALKKVELEIEQNMIADKLSQNTDKDGNLNGEGLGYVLFRTGLEGGALKENHKDVKGYSDGKQLSGLINSSVYGSIAMIAQGKGTATQNGNTTTLRTSDGVVMMKISFERGQAVVSVGGDALSPVGGAEAKEESVEAVALRALLEGQQELLAKLLKQTS
tara:strand:+ start:6405 stop:8927 length:2523 start_codon:yes stop_codon:yes gene_type:complete